MAWTVYLLADPSQIVVNGWPVQPSDPSSDFAFDAGTHGEVEASSEAISLDLWDGNTLTWATDPEIFGAHLISLLKAEAGELRAAVITDGKDAIYAAKQVEVKIWTGLAGKPEDRVTAWSAMDSEDRKWLFLYAQMEMELREEADPLAAIGRFGVGAGPSEQRKAIIEAEEQRVAAAIRAQSTIEDKQAAYDGRDFDWREPD